MQRHGHKILLAVPDDGFIDDLKIMFPKADIHIIPIVRNINLLQDLKALYTFVKLFKKQKISIIHLHTPKAALLGSIAAKLLCHPNIIFHLHGLVSLKFNKLKPGLVLFMERIPFLLAKKVLCVSESLRVLCIDNNLISSDKIITLKNGSINGIESTHRFNREKLSVELLNLEAKIKPQEQFIVGFLGRMNEDKGLVDIIKTANLLSAKIPNLIMVFVGPNEMACDFHQYLSEHLEAAFKYYPRTNQPELFIAAFDVMLFPSYREGFGLVAAEANALEVPVVAYDIVGIQDAVVNNITAYLVNPGDIQALVDALLYYKQHPKVKKQHGIDGRKHVIEKFKPEGIWEEQLHFYKRLLSE
jgi:glycosyltransferase involved in cell wall biosynthesis